MDRSVRDERQTGQTGITSLLRGIIKRLTDTVKPGRAGVLILALFILACPIRALAEASIAGIYANPGRPVLMYVKGMEGEYLGNGQDVAAAVGPISCEAYGGPIRGEKGIVFRTAILIDNSASIKSENREKMKELAKRIVQNRVDGEAFIVYTFDTELHEIASGTDYGAIIAAIEQIQFHDQDAYLVDCVATVLEQLGQGDDFDYNKIILMSDGVDDNKGGKSYVDLMAMLKEDRYRCPIYSIISVWEKNTSGLKNLQALSREVKSESFVLDEVQDLSQITSAVARDYDAKWFAIEVPLIEKDGTTKTISLAVATTQGQYDFSCNVKMPELTQEEMAELEKMQETEAPTEAPTEPPTEKKTEKPIASVVVESEPETPEPIPEPEPKSNFLSQYKYFIIGGAVLLIGLIILAIVLTLRKKKDDVFGDEGSQFTQGSVDDLDTYGKTVADDALMKGAGTFAGGGLGHELTQDEYGDPASKGQTVGMWDNFSMGSSGKKITMVDIRNAQKRYTITLRDEARIGRDSLCTIVISGDKTVSSNHCRLFLKGTDVMVEDLHSHNGTSINEKLIMQPEVLHDGDELKLGTTRLKVSIE